MKVFHLAAIISTIILTACGSPESTKNLMVVGRGEITVAGNEITLNDKFGSAEKTIEVAGDKATDYNVNAPTGKTTVNIPAEQGFYILNLRTDTLVGSLQNLNSDLNGRTMSQEELKTKIDSLVKLTSGANVSNGGNNYIIMPGQVKKLTSNADARVFGPFTKIPGTLDVGKDGKAPEIYKFYTNKEMRELIEKLKKLTF